MSQKFVNNFAVFLHFFDNNCTLFIYNSPLLWSFRWPCYWILCHLTADLRNQVTLNKARFPNYKEDLVGSVAALFRLQDTYNLTARTVVEGRIPGQDGHVLGCKLHCQNRRLAFCLFHLFVSFLPAPSCSLFPLSFCTSLKLFCHLGCSNLAIDMAAEDCFEIATLAYSASRMGHFHSWSNEALRLLREGHHDDTLKMAEVLEHVAWAEYLVREKLFRLRATN